MTRKLEYQDYLLSEHWHELRLVVLKRDGFKCVRCPSVKLLQVHHKLYRAKFEDSLPEDLITLCEPCHKAEHGLIKSKPLDGKIVIVDFKTLQVARALKQISRHEFKILSKIHHKPKKTKRIKTQRKAEQIRREKLKQFQEKLGREAQSRAALERNCSR